MPKGKKTQASIGDVFGYLTVREHLARPGNFVRCDCVCGSSVMAEVHLLVAGRVVSCRCKRRGTKGLTSAKKAFHNVNNNAKARGLRVSVGLDKFLELSQKDCTYCGSPPAQRIRAKGGAYGDFIYNGLDRIDSSKGYDEDNVTACCGTCNTAKNDMSLEEFVAWISRVNRRLNGQG